MGRKRDTRRRTVIGRAAYRAGFGRGTKRCNDQAPNYLRFRPGLSDPWQQRPSPLSRSPGAEPASASPRPPCRPSCPPTFSITTCPVAVSARSRSSRISGGSRRVRARSSLETPAADRATSVASLSAATASRSRFPSHSWKDCTRYVRGRRSILPPYHSFTSDGHDSPLPRLRRGDRQTARRGLAILPSPGHLLRRPSSATTRSRRSGTVATALVRRTG